MVGRGAHRRVLARTGEIRSGMLSRCLAWRGSERSGGQWRGKDRLGRLFGVPRIGEPGRAQARHGIGGIWSISYAI